MAKLETPHDVSERLGIPETTLAQWRYKKVGPPFIKAGRHIRYRLEAVEVWLDEQTRGWKRDMSLGSHRAAEPDAIGGAQRALTTDEIIQILDVIGELPDPSPVTRALAERLRALLSARQISVGELTEALTTSPIKFHKQ